MKCENLRQLRIRHDFVIVKFANNESIQPRLINLEPALPILREEDFGNVFGTMFLA